MRKQLRVLIVEDNPSDAELIVIALRREGIDPSWKRAESADELRAALAAQSWDAILSDYNMPTFSAEAALKIVRSEDLVVPFLVVSGSVGEDVAVELMRGGVNDYVLKDNLLRLAPALKREVKEAENRRARKQLDAEMRASEIRYRRLFEAAQDGILIVDPNSRQILDANPFMTKLLAYQREELVGKELWEIGLYKDIEANKEAFRTLQEQGYIRHAHLPLKTRDGCQVDVEFVSNTYEAGGSRVIQCNIRDITDQKRAERALQKSEAAHRKLAEQLSTERARLIMAQSVAKIGSWETDLTTMSAIWSAETYRIFETDPHTFRPTHQGFLEFVHPDDLAALDEMFRQSLDKGTASVIEHRLLMPDGRLKFVEQRWQTIYNDQGKPSRAVGTSQDITERRWAAEMLNTMAERTQRRERMLTTMLSSISDFTYLFDRAGRFLFVNQPLLDLWGITLAEAIGKDFCELGYAEELCQKLERQIQEVFATNKNLTDETPYTSPAGVQGYYEYIFSPAFADDGTVEFVVGCTRDISERKQSEKALRASEAEFRTLAEAVPNIFWITRPDGWCIYLNQKWMDYTGLTLEESLGESWIKPFHPDDQQRAWNAWQHATATTGTYEIEVRMRRADGDYRWWLIRGIPHQDADGNIHKWFGTCTDIDDLKQAEAGRMELLTRLTLQIERMPLACIQFDADFRITDWNPAAERVFGYSNDEVFGKQPSETIVPSQSRAFVADLFARLAKGDMHAHGTCENVTKDGRAITSEWHNTPLFDLDGNFQGILSLAKDVTDERKDAEALISSEMRFKHVLASSPAILFTLEVADDQIRGITWISDNLKEILGYLTVDALSPEWWSGNIDPEVREAVRSKIHKELFGRGYSTQEYRFRHRDGQYRWIQEEIRLIRDTTNRPVEAIGSWSNITARKQLEMQFHQAQKMEAFGQLAGGVAHDFNNLLTVIIGYSDMLRQSLRREDPSRDLVVEIHKAGQRSAVLTRQLLAFSRQQVLAPRVLDLNDIVSNTDKMLRRLIGEDVRLTTSLSSKLEAVRVDSGQIEQVLLNLAVNARDAMPQGGQLTIATENVDLSESYAQTLRDAVAGPQVLLRVTDTGTGMSPEVQARIFEPFFTTKEVGQGTGLGLATVFGIIKQSGGHIEVSSQMGMGTTFKIFLPRAEKAIEDSGSASQILVPPRGKETLLLVEDELAVRGLTRHVLAACGYSVLEAADGNEANRVAARHVGPIHLVITDVVMPGAGGRVVAESIVERYPNIRVLFISGYTDDAVIRHGVYRDRVNFLQKPFTPFSLAVKVREVLDSLKPDQPTSDH